MYETRGLPKNREEQKVYLQPKTEFHVMHIPISTFIRFGRDEEAARRQFCEARDGDGGAAGDGGGVKPWFTQ